jgi:peptidoglycan/LPS O-acetylase OafA/YrhL
VRHVKESHDETRVLIVIPEATRIEVGAARGFLDPARLTPAASGYLDAVRALAALAVMFGHCRGFYFVDYSNIDPAKAIPIIKAIYAVTGFGHQAVMIFFVLSGFFISSSILRSLERRTWCWRDYMIDRGARLYMVLIPGLFLGLAWDLAGITFFNRSGIYSAPLVPFGYGIPVERLGPATFIGNLLFLQTRFTTVFGSNGPLWSLFNEFWYYILFPALIAMIVSVRRCAIRSAMGYILLAALTAWILGSQLIGFVVWLSGGVVALTLHSFRFSDSSRRIAGLYATGVGAFFCICLFAAHAGSQRLGSDLAVGLSFSLFLHGLLQVQLPMGGFGLTLSKTFAGFSYSLYVLHFPMLLFIRAKWLPTIRWQPDSMHLAYGLGISACTLLYAFAVARMTERNTPALRTWLRNRLI